MNDYNTSLPSNDLIHNNDTINDPEKTSHTQRFTYKHMTALIDQFDAYLELADLVKKLIGDTCDMSAGIIRKFGDIENLIQEFSVLEDKYDDVDQSTFWQLLCKEGIYHDWSPEDRAKMMMGINPYHRKDEAKSTPDNRNP